MSIKMASILSHHLLFLILLAPELQVNISGEMVEETAANPMCLRVEAPKEVTEGETADLTCNTTCSLTDPTFIWYKNGRPLTTKTIKNNQLHLQTVSSEDAGSYSCAVRGSQHLRSTAHSLRVRYRPKRVSVSISPSGEIVEGSSATLTCSSDGNPPVECHWFIGTLLVVKEKNYTIPSASSEDSGEYKCKCMNELGERYSEALTLDVWYPTKNISVSISPSGEIVEGSSVTLTCSSDGNPPVKNYTWFKEGGTSPVGSGQNYSIISVTADYKGWYHCEAWNKLGRQNASAALFLHPVRSYTTVFVTVGIACIGTVIIVCFVYLLIRRAKRTVQGAPSRPCKVNNTALIKYASGEVAYGGLKDKGSSFHEIDEDANDTYVVPDDLDDPYANVNTDSAEVACMNHDKDGSPDYENVNWNRKLD
ncbi:B-cell receptor CD22-like [Pygocentrus nattereri]|uniref:B-cell receptor CD22-like n=1 Tax=Pygocentrus nattereri TaxID=42514 RepID=UPI001891ACA0|nr:B-cell receptor CD22-like [Pygocentrus nattereri]XP_037399375.1 B-cell receptor CD22-like [Pygocentrus nattereri]